MEMRLMMMKMKRVVVVVVVLTSLIVSPSSSSAAAAATKCGRSDCWCGPLMDGTSASCGDPSLCCYTDHYCYQSCTSAPAPGGIDTLPSSAGGGGLVELITNATHNHQLDDVVLHHIHHNDVIKAPASSSSSSSSDHGHSSTTSVTSSSSSLSCATSLSLDMTSTTAHTTRYPWAAFPASLIPHHHNNLTSLTTTTTYCGRCLMVTNIAGEGAGIGHQAVKVQIVHQHNNLNGEEEEGIQLDTDTFNQLIINNTHAHGNTTNAPRLITVKYQFAAC